MRAAWLACTRRSPISTRAQRAYCGEHSIWMSNGVQSWVGHRCCASEIRIMRQSFRFSSLTPKVWSWRVSCEARIRSLLRRVPQSAARAALSVMPPPSAFKAAIHAKSRAYPAPVAAFAFASSRGGSAATSQAASDASSPSVSRATFSPRARVGRLGWTASSITSGRRSPSAATCRGAQDRRHRRLGVPA